MNDDMTIDEIANEVSVIMSTPEDSEFVEQLRKQFEDSTDVENIFSQLQNYLKSKPDELLPSPSLLHNLNCMEDDNQQNILVTLFYPSNEEEEDYITEIDLEDEDEDEEKSQIAYFQAEVEHLSKTLGISQDVALIFLLKKQWNMTIIPSLYVNNKESLLKECHLENVEDLTSPLSFQSHGKGFCPVCFDEDTDLLRNYCGHSMCSNCWKQLILVQIQDGNLPNCNHQDEIGRDLCSSLIMEHEIKQFVDDDTFNHFKLIQFKFFVISNPNVIECPGFNCHNLLKLNEATQYQTICCDQCKNVICSSGEHESHAPLFSCSLIDDFKIKVAKTMSRHAREVQQWIAREENLRLYRQNHKSEVRQAFNQEKEIMSIRHRKALNDIKERIRSEERNISCIQEQYLLKTITQEEYEKRLLEANQKKELYQTQLNNEQSLQARTVKAFDEKVDCYFQALTEGFQFYILQFQEAAQKVSLEYMSLSDDDFVSKITKPCPQCKSLISREEGCNYINCYTCKHEFCWVCEGPWDLAHSDYHFVCPKFSQQIQSINSCKDDDIKGGIDYANTNDKTFYPFPMDSETQALYLRYNELSGEHIARLKKYNDFKAEGLIGCNTTDLSTVSKNQIANSFTLSLLYVLMKNTSKEKAKEKQIQIFHTILYAKRVVAWGFPTLYYVKQWENAKILEFKIYELSKNIDEFIEKLKENYRSYSLVDIENTIQFIEKLINNIFEQAFNFLN